MELCKKCERKLVNGFIAQGARMVYTGNVQWGGGGGGGEGRIMTPYRFFLCCMKTVCGRKMKLSDF